MRKASHLRVGDRFRPAHPSQLSFNGFEMSRDVVYRVTKVFGVPPYVRVCFEASDKKREGPLYTLLPSVFVLYPEESPPTEENLADFVTPKKKLLGYRIKCTVRDVDELDVVLGWRERKFLRLMLSLGKKTVDVKDIDALWRNHSHIFQKQTSIFSRFYKYYTKQYLPLGLMEEVFTLPSGAEEGFKYEEQGHRDNGEGDGPMLQG